MLEDGAGEKICPPMPQIIDSSDIHLEIEHLVVVPEAIPLNYRLILYEVKFGPGQTRIVNPENNPDLLKLSEALEKSPELILEIGGHTDRSGSEVKNKALSKERAKFVYDFLIKKGISTEQINYRGYGSSLPAFSNKYKSGRENNRRIEVKIIQKKDFGTDNLVDESAYEEDYFTPKKLNKYFHNVLKEDDRFVLDRLTFAPNSTVISDSLNEDLLQMLRYLNANPSIKAEVGGFTDNSGIAEKNDSLSEERAKAVYLYFIQNGIDEKRLKYKGYGDKSPIAPNRQRWGRDKNRRIEIKITEI
jgi:outer membrane protein OmpA-like peptidoglycan-associated protein